MIAVKVAVGSEIYSSPPSLAFGLFSLFLVLSYPVTLLRGQPAFKVDAQYVKVPVTVLDESGHSVMGLTAEDFQLFDEEERREIANFILDRAPVNVVFLLDTSGSVKEELKEIKYATIRFAQNFGSDDRIAIAAFSDEVRTLQTWTNKIGDLRKSLRKLEQGYRTALYDALLATAHEKLARVTGKKVIILLTDGLDNESEATYEKVMTELTSLDVILYIVSRTRFVQSRVEESERVEFLDRVMKNVLDEDTSFVDVYFREKEVSMNHLAEVNAGRVFYPEKLQALGLTYVRIARELKTQYLLTFLPADGDGKTFRRIRVVCNKPVADVYHRRLYRVR